MKQAILFLLLAVAIPGLTACRKPADPDPGPQTGQFTVQLDHLVDSPSNPLVLNTNTYKNEHGDNFTVSALKYYISNVQLVNWDGTVMHDCAPNQYFLVDQATPASQLLHFGQVPLGAYTNLSFTLGVDSTRVKAGNFTGVLDASYGMYRPATQDFVNLRLTGTSTQSPTGQLAFEVAGYRGLNTTLRNVRITLPIPYSTTNTAMYIRANNAPQVHVAVLVYKFFTGPNAAGPAPFQNPLSFASVYSFNGGAAAAKMADNIAKGAFYISYYQSN